MNAAGFAFIEKTYKLSEDTSKEYSSLQITILGLSVTIAGVVIPLLISNDLDSISIKDNLFIAVVLFGANILWGIIHHAVSLSSAHVLIWKNADHRLEEMNKIREIIKNIKKLDNNNEAGVAFMNLTEKVVSLGEKDKKILEKIQFGDLVFFGLFISAVVLTFVSVLRIL